MLWLLGTSLSVAFGRLPHDCSCCTCCQCHEQCSCGACQMNISCIDSTNEGAVQPSLPLPDLLSHLSRAPGTAAARSSTNSAPDVALWTLHVQAPAHGISASHLDSDLAVSDDGPKEASWVGQLEASLSSSHDLRDPSSVNSSPINNLRIGEARPPVLMSYGYDMPETSVDDDMSSLWFPSRNLRTYSTETESSLWFPSRNLRTYSTVTDSPKAQFLQNTDSRPSSSFSGECTSSLPGRGTGETSKARVGSTVVASDLMCVESPTELGGKENDCNSWDGGTHQDANTHQEKSVTRSQNYLAVDETKTIDTHALFLQPHLIPDRKKKFFSVCHEVLKDSPTRGQLSKSHKAIDYLETAIHKSPDKYLPRPPMNHGSLGRSPHINFWNPASCQDFEKARQCNKKQLVERRKCCHKGSPGAQMEFSSLTRTSISFESTFHEGTEEHQQCNISQFETMGSSCALKESSPTCLKSPIGCYCSAQFGSEETQVDLLRVVKKDSTQLTTSTDRCRTCLLDATLNSNPNPSRPISHFSTPDIYQEIGQELRHVADAFEQDHKQTCSPSSGRTRAANIATTVVVAALTGVLLFQLVSATCK